MSKQRLLHFLPQYKAERPMIMHQNKYEQVEDVNRRYIVEVYRLFERTKLLKKALFNIDEHMIEAVEYLERERDAQKTIPVNQEKEWVNHPKHYNPGVYEAIKVIDAYDLNFCLATSLRYILRAGKKHPEKYVEDLRKAIWYLNHEIERYMNRHSKM